ncbi:Theileria-specific hypothetical protein, putative [Theileria annulata]|uniref:Uncharacterized protein n=1 Tax=Theileria annulata TaxID=5874 RepID=Q4UAZ6_THEAN|nr:Theileria-specific hypothetical protein, putative [Theileria annulata]CAI76005.1 Theileria-specific hypothetical protein, putative [Theileria annulata]|eukprot:XP_955481.1 Theileria-specific hypothetical protein, putative [Theileria annulata]
MIGLCKICILLTFMRGVFGLLVDGETNEAGTNEPIYANIKRPNTTRFGGPRQGNGKAVPIPMPPMVPKHLGKAPPPPIRTTSLEQRPIVKRPTGPPPPPPIRTTSLENDEMEGDMPMDLPPPPPPISDSTTGHYDLGREMREKVQRAVPPKPIRGVPRDFDDLIDGIVDVEDDDDDDDDEQIIRCKVEAKRPYSVSPKITLTGIKERYNALLIGYDTHMDEKRANKASLYGWSTPKIPSKDGVSKFDFDLDYVSILPQGGIPLSYCALIFVPPVVPKFDTQSVFSRPAMSLARYIASEEHLVKALKKKNKKVTSCCFIAYPMVSKR